MEFKAKCRLWVLLSDFKNDIVFSEDSIQNAGKQYFKIRNFMRYLSNNLYINSYDTTKVSPEIKKKISELEDKINHLVDEFDIPKLVRVFIDFLSKYSSGLSEEIKNKFYESGLDSDFRIEKETEFYFLLISLNKILFPILPFLSTEINNIINNEK